MFNLILLITLGALGYVVYLEFMKTDPTLPFDARVKIAVIAGAAALGAWLAVKGPVLLAGLI